MIWTIYSLPLDVLGSVAFTPVKNDMMGNVKVDDTIKGLVLSLS